MKMIRRENPWSPGPFLGDMWMERALRDFAPFTRWFGSMDPFANNAYRSVAGDLYEDDHHYHVRVEIPGARPEEVEVKMEKEMLHISFQRNEENGGGAVSLARSFALPGPVDVDSIKAKLLDGILTVSLPRSPESKPHVIPVE